MSTLRAILALTILCLWAAAGTAQELSPRAYWPAPKGIKVVILGYSYSTGDVLTDPSLPIYGVDSSINTGFLGYLQIFSLWGRTATAIVEVPYSWGTTKGTLEGDPARADFTGLNDFGVTLAVNLLGAPSMTREDFHELRANPRPILGASVRVLPPTGRYDPDKLINTGANRWAVKAEMGYIIPLKPKWPLELEAGVWFFGENPEFVQGPRKQDPIYSLEIHLVHRFKPGFWASIDVNHFTGGRSTIDGEQRADLQRNSKMGGTVVVPFRRRHALKFGYSTGVLTETGSDFDQVLVSYQAAF